MGEGWLKSELSAIKACAACSSSHALTIWALSPSTKFSPCRKSEEAARNFGKRGAAEGAMS
jgi:hypothetical protein